MHEVSVDGVSIGQNALEQMHFYAPFLNLGFFPPPQAIGHVYGRSSAALWYIIMVHVFSFSLLINEVLKYKNDKNTGVPVCLAFSF